MGKSYRLALLGLTGSSGSGCSYGCSGGLSGLSLRFPKRLQSCLNPSPSTCSLYLGEARGSRGGRGIGMRVSQVLRRSLLFPSCTGRPPATPSVPMPLCLSTRQRGPPRQQRSKAPEPRWPPPPAASASQECGAPAAPLEWRGSRPGRGLRGAGRRGSRALGHSDLAQWEPSRLLPPAQQASNTQPRVSLGSANIGMTPACCACSVLACGHTGLNKKRPGHSSRSWSGVEGGQEGRGVFRVWVSTPGENRVGCPQQALACWTHGQIWALGRGAAALVKHPSCRPAETSLDT